MNKILIPLNKGKLNATSTTKNNLQRNMHLISNQYSTHKNIRILTATGKWLHTILAQDKLDLSVHILVVDSFAFLEIHTTSRLIRFLIEACAPELIENALFPQHSVDETAGVFDVVVLHQHCASNEAGMSDWHRVAIVVRKQRRPGNIAASCRVLGLFWFGVMQLFLLLLLNLIYFGKTAVHFADFALY